MNGKFYTDITRDTFRLHKHYSRVLMQQGRVQLDSDWNEQVDILLHYLRTFIGDVIGSHGCFDDGFKVEKYTRIEQVPDTKGKRTRQKASETAPATDVPYHFLIGRGHCYVHGILCENDRHEHVFSIPPSMRSGATQPKTAQGSADEKDEEHATYCIHLDVWEREVTYLEDSFIREVALGGPDTTTRSEVVCKICVVRVEDAGENAPDRDDSKYLDEKGKFQLARFASDWTTHLQNWKEGDHGYLQAETVDVEQSSKEPCVVPPTSQYRGMENQLYRVEIHKGGEPASATFKWSRENGAVMFPIISSLVDSSGQPQKSLAVTLGNLGRDDSRFGLNVDDWVEIVNVGEAEEVEEDTLPGGQVMGPLMRVQGVDLASRQVTLVNDKGITLEADAQSIFFLRRWDYHAGDPADKHTPKIAPSGALHIVPGWLTLEHGIQIQFDADKATTYRSGDYWLIPARTATGKIEWARHNNQADRLSPHGVKHYYAPLCHVRLTGGKIAEDSDLLHLRRVIERPY